MIYLDHNATTPLCDEARAAQDEALRFSANPSSIHREGRQARVMLDRARGRLSELLEAETHRLVFAASGSEANNLAIKGAVFAVWPQPAHIVISAIEHDCSRRAARWLADNLSGVTLTEVPAGQDGVVRADDVLAALRPETKLVSLMLANHETGMIQPVARLAPALRARGVLLHCDAAQSMGRMPVSLRELGCDLLSLAAHKFYGPHGAGLLCVRDGLALTPLTHGGLQEFGMRAGTANLPGMAGMAAAAQAAVARLDEARAHLSLLERIFWDELCQAQLPAVLNGDWNGRLPGVLNLSIARLKREDLTVGMDASGVAISAGSACASGVMEPSPVLTAMGLPADRIRGGVRISFGRENSVEEARQAAKIMILLAGRLGRPAHSQS